MRFVRNGRNTADRVGAFAFDPSEYRHGAWQRAARPEAHMAVGPGSSALAGEGLAQRSAEIESCAELLRTIAGVLDVRTVFPRVS